MSGGVSVDFFKKAGLIAGGTLAVISLGGMLSGFAIRFLVTPEIERIVVEERRARVAADSIMTASVHDNSIAIAQLSEDRITILAILALPPGKARIRVIEQLRGRWGPRYDQRYLREE